MPALEQKVALTSQLIKSASALVGLAAPTWALIELGRLPARMAATATIILPLVTVALTIVIFIIGPGIGRLGGKLVALLLLACVAAGAVLTVAYERTAYSLVVGRDVVSASGIVQTDRDVRPLYPSPRIHEILNPYEGNYHRALKRSPHSEELKGLMNSQDGSAIALILGIMILAQLLFVAAIVGGAWWLAEHNASSSGSEPALSNDESRDSHGR